MLLKLYAGMMPRDQTRSGPRSKTFHEQDKELSVYSLTDTQEVPLEDLPRATVGAVILLRRLP